VYVRPLVEYNSVIWSPSTVKDISALESVQRRFTKRLHGLKNCTYQERLKSLNILSLELRRLHADLILTYKILFGHVHVDVNLFDFCSTRSSFFCERITNV